MITSLFPAFCWGFDFRVKIFYTMALNLAQSAAAAPCFATAGDARRAASVVAMPSSSSSATTSLRMKRQAACEPVACRAVARHVAAAAASSRRNGVPVFVMMPLDTVSKCGSALNRRKAVAASLAALKSAGVEGIMVDVWWGIAECEGPGRYNFTGYMELMEMAKKNGLKVQAVMSFHQCGGNVGDSVTYVSLSLLLLFSHHRSLRFNFLAFLQHSCMEWD